MSILTAHSGSRLWRLRSVSEGAEGPSAVEYYWRKMLSSRSWKGEIWWKKFQQIKARFPLLRPKLHLPYGALQALATPL